MATWNSAFQKLTTSDRHGMIIVWILQEVIRPSPSAYLNRFRAFGMRK